MNESTYLNMVHTTLWNWANKHCVELLDGCTKKGRPPVLKREFEDKNVLVPPDEQRADAIRKVIPERRHKHFNSLKSSQALAQSIFGALLVFDRLDVLAGIAAECGRPAFFADNRAWDLEMEHKVDTLNEKPPSRTSIDVLFSNRTQRVAVECKFTEKEFGMCSRTDRKLKLKDPSKYCDGNYRVQSGRRERCALTETDIRYWQYLPRIFNWPAESDHFPCPFNPGYQLARNALGACFAPNGAFDPSQGHVLVVYDARNPAFQQGGKAERQWQGLLDACCVPGLLRRTSWQRLAAAIAAKPDFTWLSNGLHDKYGIEPVASGPAKGLLWRSSGAC